MKENVGNVSENQVNMRLNSENSKQCKFKKNNEFVNNLCDWLQFSKHITKSKNFIFFVYIKCI